jgi:hypothetical protein
MIAEARKLELFKPARDAAIQWAADQDKVMAAWLSIYASALRFGWTDEEREYVVDIMRGFYTMILDSEAHELAEQSESYLNWRERQRERGLPTNDR